MKTKILIPVVSVVLFATSMVGLLAVQGRLNYEGTRGVPIVSMFFKKPPEKDGEHKDGEHKAGEAKDGGAQDGEHKGAEPGKDGEPAKAGVTGGDEHGTNPTPTADAAKDGHGETPKTGDAGHGEPARPETHGDSGKPDAHGAPPPAGGHEDKPQDGHGKAEEPSPQAGKLPATFLYPPVQSRMTAEELMAAAAQIDEKRRKLDQERAQLEFEREALAVRERDVEDRRKQVRNDMALVQSKSDELEKRIKDFESQTALLKRQEQKNFKEQAEKLALMDPKRASEYLVEFGAEGEDRAVKLLASMDAESAAKILESMDPKRGARLLERGLKLVREGGQ